MTEEERYDLFEDVIVKLKFEPLTRAEQHAQLKRVEAAEREQGPQGAGSMRTLQCLAIALFAVVVAVVLICMYATWRDCEVAGGVPVRGLFWLECVASPTQPK